MFEELLAAVNDAIDGAGDSSRPGFGLFAAGSGIGPRGGPAVKTVVVTLFDGPVIVQRLEAQDPEPSADDLAAIAAEWVERNGGVRPTVRVLENTALRANPLTPRSGAAILARPIGRAVTTEAGTIIEAMQPKPCGVTAATASLQWRPST